MCVLVVMLCLVSMCDMVIFEMLVRCVMLDMWGGLVGWMVVGLGIGIVIVRRLERLYYIGVVYWVGWLMFVCCGDVCIREIMCVVDFVCVGCSVLFFDVLLVLVC